MEQKILKVYIKAPEQEFGLMDLRTELEGGVKCNIEVQIEKVD